MTLLDILSNEEMVNAEKILLIFLNEAVGKGDRVDVKLNDISKYTHMSRPSILRAISKLTELNLIEVKKNFGPNGVNMPNTYILLRGKIKK